MTVDSEELANPSLSVTVIPAVASDCQLDLGHDTVIPEKQLSGASHFDTTVKG